MTVGKIRGDGDSAVSDKQIARKFKHKPVALDFKDNEERYKKQKELPKGFNIELTNRCNYNCPMCPKSLNLETFDDISFELIKKIVKQFNGQPLYLPLFKRGESLLRKDLEQIVDFIKSENPDNYIVINSNGFFLREDKYSVIKKLDRINVSITTTHPPLYKTLTGMKETQYHRVKENIIRLEKEVDMKSEIGVMFMAIDDNLSYREEFYSFWSQYNVTIYEQCWIDWARMKRGLKGQEVPQRFPCMHLWCYPAVNLEGTVSICCNDYFGAHTVGDLNKETFRDIWHGEEMEKIRQLHLEGQWDDISICKNCFGWGYHENPFVYDDKTKKFSFKFD